MHPTRTLIALLLSLAPIAQASDPVYCNGQRTHYAGDQLYPNGKRVRYAGDYLYPNGARTVYAGDRLYPNGNRMDFAGEELYANGQRVLYAGDLYYPNGKRVEYAGDCYFSTGVRMDQCPSRVGFREMNAGITIIGTLDLAEKKIHSRSFEYEAEGVRTYFDLDEKGNVTGIGAVCD